jgi:hypothetical protein
MSRSRSARELSPWKDLEVSTTSIEPAALHEMHLVASSLTHLPSRHPDERSLSHCCYLLTTQEVSRADRNSPRLAQKCRNPPYRQDYYQQPDHRRHKGLQVQDALRVRTFPNQRQHGEEQGDRQLRD